MPSSATVSENVKKPGPLMLLGDVIPVGGGHYKIVPQKPLGSELTPKQAAAFLGVSRQGVYRLIELDILKHRRPTPGKILIDLESLQRHRAGSSDPEYWERR